MPSRKQDRYLESLESYVGERVRAERLRLRLKQAQLAERADKSVKWTSRIESQGDSVSLHSLGALARALALEPGDLLPTSETRVLTPLAREGWAIIESADQARSKKPLELMVKLLSAVRDAGLNLKQ